VTRMELEAPKGVVASDDDGGLTIRIVRDRILGLVSVALGTAMAGLSYTMSDPSWTTWLLYAMDVVIIYAGLAWLLGTRIVRVDAHRVTSRLWPLPLVPRNVSIDRTELDRVELISGRRGTYGAVAELVDGRSRLLAAFRDSDKTARAAATYVVERVRAALSPAHPATGVATPPE